MNIICRNIFLVTRETILPFSPISKVTVWLHQSNIFKFYDVVGCQMYLLILKLSIIIFITRLQL